VLVQGCFVEMVLGTDLEAFCGVSRNSPPKCLSKENRLEGEPTWDSSEEDGSSWSSGSSAVAEG